MRSALIEQSPLTVTACAIRVYGVSEALFIQQLWYWQSQNRNMHDNESWVFNTYEAWSEQLGIPPPRS